MCPRLYHEEVTAGLKPKQSGAVNRAVDVNCHLTCKSADGGDKPPENQHGERNQCVFSKEGGSHSCRKVKFRIRPGSVTLGKLLNVTQLQARHLKN